MSAKHHEQVLSTQIEFLKHVKSPVNGIDQLGNPFKDSGDLLSLDMKDIMPAEVAQSVKSAKKIGQNQYKNFIKEWFVERTKPITDPIKHKIPLFLRVSFKLLFFFFFFFFFYK